MLALTEPTITTPSTKFQRLALRRQGRGGMRTRCRTTYSSETCVGGDVRIVGNPELARTRHRCLTSGPSAD